MRTNAIRQATVLESASGGRWIDASRPRDYHAALRLHEQGLLSRDPRNSYRFRITPAGSLAIERLRK